MKRSLGVFFGLLIAIFITNFSGNVFATDIPKKEIITIQPRLITEEFFPPSTLKGVTENLANKFPNDLNYTDTYEYRDIITTNAVKKFGRNQVIFWRGHGSWDEENEQPIILTGRDFNPEEAEADIIVEDGYYEAITPEYINKYVGDLSGTFIYLNVCESAHNSKIIDAFLNKGAVAVVGSTNTAEMTYSNNVQDMVITLLGELNPETGNYYTINEALTRAKQEYGETDPGSGGEIVILGNKNYRLISISEEKEENIPSVPDSGQFTKTDNDFISQTVIIAVFLATLITSLVKICAKQ